MRAVVAIGLMLMVAACGGSPGPTPLPSAPAASAPSVEPSPVPSAATHVMRGIVRVPGLASAVPATCAPDAAYADVLVGTSLVVQDEDGQTIGTAPLAFDRLASPTDYSTWDEVSFQGEPCLLEYEVRVPDAAFYRIVIAGHAGPTVSRADLDAAKWHRDVVLGV